MHNLSDFSDLFKSLQRGDEYTALSFYRGRSKIDSLSSRELFQKIRDVSNYLIHLGVKSGDRLLILSPNRMEIPVLVLAIIAAGGIVVPLNPNSTVEDWVKIAAHSEACGIFSTPDHLSILGHSNLKTRFSLPVSELFLRAGPSGSFPQPVRGSEDPAIILYTSGTTGDPKGVSLSQRNLLYNAQSMAQRFGLKNSTQFAVLPLYHAHALGFGLMSSLVSRSHLVFTETLDPFAWASVIRSESVEFTSVVPSLLPSLLSVRVRQEKVPTLRTILVSSAPLSYALARDFETKAKIKLIQGWGLSEYTNFACCLSPHDSLEGSHLIGPPLVGTQVQVVDGAGNPLPEGSIGELCVRGPSQMLGYFKDPVATAQVYFGDWLRTGDQGSFTLVEGMPYFTIHGRIKEIIIRSGEKISPLTVEKKLIEALPEWEGKLVALGFHHQIVGEEIGAYLESETLDEAMRSRLEIAIGSLPHQLRPKVLLHSGEKIPRTHTGKIQRRKLQPWFSDFDSCHGQFTIQSRS